MTTAEPVLGFLLELDALKTVTRKNYIHDGSRQENSAEHSWHLAMACWSFARAFELELDEGKLLKLALVHDLGEIDAGDTFLYASDRSDAHLAEGDCIARLQAIPGNPIKELTDLWHEQETGRTAEARLLKVVDRLLPFCLNIVNGGRTWRELGVNAQQVANAHAFIAHEYPTIHQWVSNKLELAVASGWIDAGPNLSQ